MQITVNGETRDVSPEATIQTFLTSTGLDPKQVVVERNGTIVPRDEFPDSILQEGDQLEVVRLVGGG